jgi:hypothetical protein
MQFYYVDTEYSADLVYYAHIIIPHGKIENQQYQASTVSVEKVEVYWRSTSINVSTKILSTLGPSPARSMRTRSRPRGGNCYGQPNRCPPGGSRLGRSSRASVHRLLACSLNHSVPPAKFNHDLVRPCCHGSAKPVSVPVPPWPLFD